MLEWFWNRIMQANYDSRLALLCCCTILENILMISHSFICWLWMLKYRWHIQFALTTRVHVRQNCWYRRKSILRLTFRNIWWSKPWVHRDYETKPLGITVYYNMLHRKHVLARNELQKNMWKFSFRVFESRKHAFVPIPFNDIRLRRQLDL